MSNACSILIAKTIIGDGGSWRGIDDCRALQCFVVLFTSVMTSLMSGSSPSLHLHGIPAPHWQPTSASQARSAWFSHTHPTPKQIGQFFIHLLDRKKVGGTTPVCRRGGLSQGHAGQSFHLWPTYHCEVLKVVPAGTNPPFPRLSLVLLCGAAMN